MSISTFGVFAIAVSDDWEPLTLKLIIVAMPAYVRLSDSSLILGVCHESNVFTYPKLRRNESLYRLNAGR